MRRASIALTGCLMALPGTAVGAVDGNVRASALKFLGALDSGELKVAEGLKADIEKTNLSYVIHPDTEASGSVRLKVVDLKSEISACSIRQITFQTAYVLADWNCGKEKIGDTPPADCPDCRGLLADKVMYMSISRVASVLRVRMTIRYLPPVPFAA